jgi:hypothetical protein
MTEILLIDLFSPNIYRYRKEYEEEEEGKKNIKL